MKVSNIGFQIDLSQKKLYSKPNQIVVTTIL